MKSTTLIHLSYDGNFQTNCISTIEEFRHLPENNDTDAANVAIVLGDTVMHPQGGGQPSDYGVISLIESEDDGDGQQQPLLSVPISHVNVDRTTGVVTHDGKIDNNDLNDEVLAKLKPGNKVKVVIDESRRRILSECHTAGHVVDAAMARCGQTFPPTKGYHFLDGPYVEYKGSVPANQRADLLEHLKVAFQELVNEDIKTNIETLSKEGADEKCNRLAKNFDFSDSREEVRVVSIAGWCCPCGGTHVSSTIDLKDRGWEVSGIKSKKGVVRIKYNTSSIES